MTTERPKLNHIHQGDFDKPAPPLKIVTEEEWLVERRKLLEAEKDLMRHQDAVTLMRRSLPAVQVKQDYKFIDVGDNDKEVSFMDLFKGETNKPLIVQHVMGGSYGLCQICSTWVDQISAIAPQLSDRAHYVVTVSARDAEPAAIKEQAAKKGWIGKVRILKASFDFGHDFSVSRTESECAEGNTFMYNFAPGVADKVGFSGMSQLPGQSFFVVQDDKIVKTNAVHTRGLENVMGLYQLLDHTPRGRCGFFPRHREEITDYAVGPKTPPREDK